MNNLITTFESYHCQILIVIDHLSTYNKSYEGEHQLVCTFLVHMNLEQMPLAHSSYLVYSFLRPKQIGATG
jgi:hypothetical protein